MYHCVELMIPALCYVQRSVLAVYCSEASDKTYRQMDTTQTFIEQSGEPNKLMIIVTRMCTVTNPRRHDDAIFPFCGLPCRGIIRSFQSKLRSRNTLMLIVWCQIISNQCCRHHHTESHQKHQGSRMDARVLHQPLCASQDQAPDSET
jgi:hypothetical protein